MAALIGCTNVITYKIAADGVEISTMSVEADVGFDRRGVNPDREVDVPFPDIKLTINISTTASASEVDKIKRDLAKFCPLAKVFRQADTTIDEEWVVTRPTASGPRLNPGVGRGIW
jgi:putative redox protein